MAATFIFDVGEVHGVDDDEEECRRNPGRDLGPPKLHIEANGGQFSHTDQHIQHPIVPAGQKTGKAVPILVGKEAERAGDRLFGNHLTELTHDQKCDETTQRITEQHGRASHLDGLTDTKKQAGTDGTAQGNELDMAILQAALEIALLSDFHGNNFLFNVQSSGLIAAGLP